ncbi:MAG: hypothetical protein PVH91_06595 [Pseudomonadales bacterium]
MTLTALDRLFAALTPWWHERSGPCRWLVGCTATAICLGVAGGLLGA